MNPLDSLNENNLVYISMDGDGIGRHIGQAVLSDNPEEVETISHKINMGQEIFGDWAHKWNGKQISFGGDEGVWQLPEEALEELETIRKDYEYATGFTVSVGVGKLMSESAKALLVAKVKGKNQTVYYSPDTEDEINQIVEDAKSGEGTDEEEKLAEAYLNPQEKENDRNSSHEIEGSHPEVSGNNKGYDSGYKDDKMKDRNESYEKQDLSPPIDKKPALKDQVVIEEATSTDIPEYDRLMNEVDPAPEDKPTEEQHIKKPAPKKYEDQRVDDSIEVDEKRNEYQKPGDLKYGVNESEEPQINEPSDNATSDIAEEEIKEDMDTQEPIPPEYSKDRENLEEDVTPVNLLDQHLDNAKDYQDSLEAPAMEGGATMPAIVQEENPEPNTTDELLDAHLQNAKEMIDEQGISRPADFDEKDEDMGLSEEEAQEDTPDISEILKEGLDNHADNIKREKIINMVGDALEGFKAQKRILDKAKEQAPELYDSCIKMLKAMIELCSLAGIDQRQPEEELGEIEGEQNLEEKPKETPQKEEKPEAESKEVPPPAPQQ